MALRPCIWLRPENNDRSELSPERKGEMTLGGFWGNISMVSAVILATMSGTA
jgi:hypothetical protein